MITREKAEKLIKHAIMVSWLHEEKIKGPNNQIGYSGRYKEDVEMALCDMKIIMVNGKIELEITIDVEHEQKKDGREFRGYRVISDVHPWLRGK